jgi:antitoxin VapB
VDDETKTEAARRARLQARAGETGCRKSLREYLEHNVWPMMPPSELGRVMTREEEDQILGYAPEGY